jgi:uncharacterized membrane protein YkgB
MLFYKREKEFNKFLMSFLYNTKEKEQRVRQNLPAEPEAKGT